MLLVGVLLLLFFNLHLPTTSAIDTLTLGQSLLWNQTLVSNGGNFELGLFSPGKSNKHYLGIWYKKIPKKTVVWVANREQPILEPSSCHLELSVHGDLRLFATAPSNTLLWSSNASLFFSPSPPPRTTVAVLQDDGNLVVKRNATLSSSAAAPTHVAWQSFDHPTDTWLPGARLGYDRGRGVHSFLTSWTDSEDPAPGAFSMVIDARGLARFDLLAGGEHRYWTTGLWDGEIFANVPEMRSGYFIGVPYAPNASINFFSYRDRIPGAAVGNFMLDVNGQMRRRQWSKTAGEWILFCSEPHDACDVHGSCGPFGVCSNGTNPACRCPAGFEPRSSEEWSLQNAASGCARRHPLECYGDGFLALPNTVRLPNGSAEAPAGARNDKACAHTCLVDCACTAYVYDGAKCLVWNGELVNMKTLVDGQGDGGLAGATLHLRVASSEVPPSSLEHSWRKSMVILGSVAAAVVVLLASVVTVVAVAAVLRMRRRRGKVTAVQGSLLLLDYRAVRTATGDFSEKLGSGSFGTVFKGALPDGTPVAVKKLDGLRQGEKQFRTEVVTLGTIQHVNLVRLRGFCCEGNKRALVYDYMANGSLDDHLFNGGPGSDSKRQVTLSWKQRYDVAVGVARGLAYLHEKCRECIIHCDVKPENILLDQDMSARLADFGMAKLVGRDFSSVLTTMRGTVGYLAPEWLAGAPITAKADVYSFGLLLFELVSGRRNNAASSSSEEGGSGIYFPVHAAVKLNEGDVAGLVDERVAKDADVKEVERLCKVAGWCIQDEEGDRPAMGLVAQQLEGIADVMLPPIPSRLHILAIENEWVRGAAEDEHCSKSGSEPAAEAIEECTCENSGSKDHPTTR
ncbi:G-type lectin S-receptor-like serine/threonine-protein kinase At2g19130 [Oryza brachyantha]|uniref:G-type lectin S-receptor-like serine/threonine-protein kinase At2g19130 n=1 Tax=Oryza brachyantha TaxID=4533 RepID=UPI0003EA88C6|nr:G-type lectin S-receptor-like serine/threonine-protein kinase At2g19130 [Oryza brachyantha]